MCCVKSCSYLHTVSAEFKQAIDSIENTDLRDDIYRSWGSLTLAQLNGLSREDLVISIPEPRRTLALVFIDEHFKDAIKGRWLIKSSLYLLIILLRLVPRAN
jgi:hypothetical protein